MTTFILTSLMTFSVPAPAVAKAQVTDCAAYEKIMSNGSISQKLDRFLDFQWKRKMSEWPEYATYLGVPGMNDRWTDDSKEAVARREAASVCELNVLKKIPRAALSKENRLTLDLALHDAQEEVESQQFDGKYLVIDQMDGLQISVPDVLQSSPTATMKDYEDRIVRLEKLPIYVKQIEDLLREGVKRKVTPPKMFLEKVPAQFDAVLTANPENSPLFEPFKKVHAEVSDDVKADLQKRSLAAIEKSAYPALKEMRNFLINEYIPGARTTTAWSDLPNGRAWYASLTKKHTTVSMTPDEFHELGLKEVARIKAEMEKIRERARFKGDLSSFNTFLQTDPQFFLTDGRALLAGYRDIGKRIDAELPRFFGHLPRLTWGVREMPLYKAKDAPTAYYEGGTADGGRSGTFEANTFDLKARPIWGMEALTLHEAVPGHHLQISIAQELTNLPEFRKNGGPTSFIEGWALYAERLGENMGFYQDIYSKYGELTYEMWRAVRLVVDTGMHVKGWSREKGLDYFMSLIPKSRMESENEINRYLTTPGQALAYKIGQLKFLELREKARIKLGAKFDIRKFHDEILSHGAIPMDVLESLFNEWLKNQ